MIHTLLLLQHFLTPCINSNRLSVQQKYNDFLENKAGCLHRRNRNHLIKKNLLRSNMYTKTKQTRNHTKLNQFKLKLAKQNLTTDQTNPSHSELKTEHGWNKSKIVQKCWVTPIWTRTCVIFMVQCWTFPDSDWKLTQISKRMFFSTLVAGVRSSGHTCNALHSAAAPGLTVLLSQGRARVVFKTNLKLYSHSETSAGQDGVSGQPGFQCWSHQDLWDCYVLSGH